MTGGIFAVLDDIAILLDDAATMSKVAAKKTAGILGDDLAVNAEKATGFQASRELPVLWAITKGSFINKLIILPVAFLLSGYAPWLIVPVLLIGGAYLCYEGVESVLHIIMGSPHAQGPETVEDKAQLLTREKEKIKSAVRTDFILSIEIIVIALGTVIEQSFLLQIMVVSFIALLATVGVYGLVALLVRMDDAGFSLIKQAEGKKGLLSWFFSRLGALLISSLPYIIRGLGVVGTIAMLLVGGGMFTHNIGALHHALDFIPSLLGDLLVGTAVGIILVAVQKLLQLLRSIA